jgi:glycosyltransferase involved in cell wall biosynthesis
MSKPTLGLAMIALNEENHLPAAISEFYPIVDDIVLVDGGSLDNTVMWAKRMGARVFHKTFPDHFSKQRNYAIENLDTDWIYFHDPDERVEPTLVKIIPDLITEAGQKDFMKQGLLCQSEKYFDCFGIPRKTLIDGVQIDVYPDYQYRLFAGYCRFQGAVDEKVINFTNRTELGQRDASDPTTSAFDSNHVSHFNIRHYKSSDKCKRLDSMFRKIKGEPDHANE